MASLNLNPGKNKRPRTHDQSTESAIDAEGKRQKINSYKAKFHEDHGDTYWVCVFKKNLEDLSKEEISELRQKLLSYQLDRGELPMKISRVMECLPDKLLKLRVHSNTDRITLHEIVKQVTFDLYSVHNFLLQGHSKRPQQRADEDLSRI